MKKNVSVIGIEEMIRKLDRHIGEQAIQDVDRITETYARKMANESSNMAPIDSGALKGSIASSPQESDESKHIWEWGSDLPYATRQEYEHRTQKGFVRKSVWNNRTPYREAVKNRLTRG